MPQIADVLVSQRACLASRVRRQDHSDRSFLQSDPGASHVLERAAFYRNRFAVIAIGSEAIQTMAFRSLVWIASSLRSLAMTAEDS
jgi:hypothetical protein